MLQCPLGHHQFVPPPFVNRWLWAAIGLSVLLQVAVVNIGFLNAAFGTVPLTVDQWLLCAAMGSAVLWYSELRKLVRFDAYFLRSL